MQHAKLGRLAIAATVSAALWGCGGGGGGGSSSAPVADAGGAGTAASSIASTKIAPVASCDATGVGSAALTADAPVTILEVSTGTAGTGATAAPYCLVKVKVDPQINIWVTMPTGDNWNGRLQSVGGGGYAGSAGVSTAAVQAGYVGIQTDTGHTGGTGEFGMLSPGVPNTQLQIDFAYRSEHLMAVIGKQLIQAFYGQQPIRSYWNGCSTGGRQGLRMAQDFPGDYDGILAGAPAIHWDRFQSYQIWPQVVMRQETGGPIAAAKLNLATSRAVAACDTLGDGVVDGVIGQPRACTYSAQTDAAITSASCTTGDNSCLTPAETRAVDRIWDGARSASGKLLWYGLERGASLTALAGTAPFSIAVNQPRYWVYLDPNWDWTTLSYSNFESFFRDTMRSVGPLMASENPDLSAYRDRGGKILMWHGLADNLIMPQGTVDYYEAVTSRLGGGYAATNQFLRLFMAPGVGHCAGGASPQPQNLFQEMVEWVEQGDAPQTILGSRTLPGGAGTQSRPICLYPTVARYSGSGDPNAASSYACVQP